MFEVILNIALAVISVVLAGFAYYLDVRKKIQEQINGEIGAAEEIGEVGAEKMAYVVSNIYNNIVPTILKPIITKKVIEQIAQLAFDRIENYAQIQMRKKSK